MPEYTGTLDIRKIGRMFLVSFFCFTQFYLKDVAWADSDLYHLGPVVAAQQIRE